MADYTRSPAGMLFGAIAILLLVLASQVEAQVDTPQQPFRNCVSRIGGQPINVIWDATSYLESMRNPDMVESVLNLTAYPVVWDSSVGAHVPADVQQLRITKTIALTMADGTLVSLIINQSAHGQYIGWMTYSTYRTTASYNPEPNPHVLCGFWSISESDYEQLRIWFLEYLTQQRQFEDWMR